MTITLQIKTGEDEFVSAIHAVPPESTIVSHDTKIVIMVHGFPGHKMAHNDLYGSIESSLIDKGYHALRFDFSGCGESAGQQIHFNLSKAKENLAAIRRWAKDSAYTDLVFISEGIASMIVMEQLSPQDKCHIMLWPCLDPQGLVETLFGTSAVDSAARKAGYITRGEDHIGVAMIDELQAFDLLPTLQNVTIPALIFHGSEDALFPIENLDIAREHLAAERIEITSFQDGEHGLLQPNHRESMFFHMAQFIEKYA